MTDLTRERLNDPAGIAVRECHFDRMRAVYGGRAPESPLLLWGYHGQGRSDFYAEPERWVAEALADLADHAELALDAEVFRPLVLECPLYGVHFIDRILGAEVFELEPGNWQAHAITRPVGTLEPPDLEADDTWANARRVAQAFLEADVALPLFGLPTLSSALNIGLNLYGQELLTAMYVDPAAAHHDLAVINDLICGLHRWYLAHIPLGQLQPVIGGARTQPPGYGQLCGCSTHLLSAELYREFSLPYDDALLSVYPNGGMIHLCGEHTQHLPTWRDLPSLRALQMNDRAAEDFETYYHGLRDDQVVYPIPCAGMPLDRILEESGGRRVVIWAEPPTVAQTTDGARCACEH